MFAPLHLRFGVNKCNDDAESNSYEYWESDAISTSKELNNIFGEFHDSQGYVMEKGNEKIL
ncbi:MAG: hypothetical protein UY52_C0005G0012 [Parcubacteria group bacterium GW2011_GWC2_49_9]|nr:MAG: hypothetical protein UY34_C0015G0010 [Parcubacteria group bacterium GW2011_GWA2_48_9]KKW16377.1 MAG: hypothetical protein UY52_C0005G0012 [Parcubacteria group bacterium GW2011_GWC2_49_9]